MFKSRIYSFAILAILTLSGCGGGGGGVSGGSANETNPPTFSGATRYDVNENQSVAFTASAADVSLPLTYSLTSALNDNDDFNIDSSSGAITFKTNPDFESGRTTYTVTVTATDKVGNSSNQVVTITILDVGDETPPIITSTDSVSVNENQTSAITIIANDPVDLINNPTPSIVYSIRGGDSASFSINSSSGEVTFNTAPDYETKASYTFTAVATDNFNNESIPQLVTITILDVGDETPPIITSTDSVSVNENQTSAITIIANDPVDLINNPTPSIVYSIRGGDSASFSINSSTGVVIFNSAPDYESKTSYTFTAEATDNFNNKATQSITININDIDGPIFTSLANQSANENQTSAFTVTANDSHSPISFSLASGVNDNNDFNINSSSGVITFKSAPDFETKNSYTLTVTATDSVANSSTQVVSLTIIDLDAPTFTSSSTPSVNENQTSAIDVDANDTSAPIVYSLASGVNDNDDFNINSSSGLVTFKTAPDFETKALYKISVTATDNASNSAIQVIDITILDVEENPPSFTSGTSTSVNENQTAAYTVTGADVSSPITYSLSSGINDNDLFNINNSNGNALTADITFKTAPDYEMRTSYTISITATDNVGNITPTPLVVTISINDIDESISFGGKTYHPITSPITGIEWLDRNLGADQVCTSSSNSSCYGDYYQWGRLTDAHEKTASSTSSTRASDILSAGSNFITNGTTPNDWLQNATQDSNNIDDDGTIRQIQWQKADGTSVCPSGYHVPTLAQLQAETTADSIQDTDTSLNGNIEVTNATTAFQNFLKLPVSGYRKGSDAAMDLVGTQGFLWSTTTSGGTSSNLYYNSGTADTSSENFVNAYPIRCVKSTFTGNYPTANAGSDQTSVLTGTNVTLDASSSSDDGSITSYTWKEGSTTLSTSVSFSKSDFSVGTHIITLIITDNDGLKSVDTVSVEIINNTTSHGGQTYNLILSPVTGKIWLDRNLGASRACISSTDSACYGDRYQWGRPTDGHEDFSGGTTGTTSATITPGNGTYILSASDWVNGGVDDNGNLRRAEWNKVDASVLCPIRFRVPTETELALETIDPGVVGKDTQVTDAATAFTNFLKLGVAGYRQGTNASLQNDGSAGFIWTTTNSPTLPGEVKYLDFRSGTASMGTLPRSYGMSIRCIRD